MGTAFRQITLSIVSMRPPPPVSSPSPRRARAQAAVSRTRTLASSPPRPARRPSPRPPAGRRLQGARGRPGGDERARPLRDFPHPLAAGFGSRGASRRGAPRPPARPVLEQREHARPEVGGKRDVEDLQRVGALLLRRVARALARAQDRAGIVQERDSRSRTACAAAASSRARAARRTASRGSGARSRSTARVQAASSSSSSSCAPDRGRLLAPGRGRVAREAQRLEHLEAHERVGIAEVGPQDVLRRAAPPTRPSTRAASRATGRRRAAVETGRDDVDDIRRPPARARPPAAPRRRGSPRPRRRTATDVAVARAPGRGEGGAPHEPGSDRRAARERTADDPRCRGLTRPRARPRPGPRAAARPRSMARRRARRFVARRQAGPTSAPAPDLAGSRPRARPRPARAPPARPLQQAARTATARTAGIGSLSARARIRSMAAGVPRRSQAAAGPRAARRGSG